MPLEGFVSVAAAALKDAKQHYLLRLMNAARSDLFSSTRLKSSVVNKSEVSQKWSKPPPELHFAPKHELSFDVIGKK